MRKKRKKFGFTLAEITVTLVIVAILASLVSVQYFRMVEKARQAEAIEILTRMYRGYKVAIMDERLIPQFSNYKLSNYLDFVPPDWKGNRCFNPDESNTVPGQPEGRSIPSWNAIGFDQNPNYDREDLYFSYDFLKPKDTFWTQQQDYASCPQDRGGGWVRPQEGTSYDSIAMGVAWRKTNNTRWPSGLFSIDSTKYIFINMDNGTIVKSAYYQ